MNGRIPIIIIFVWPLATLYNFMINLFCTSGLSIFYYSDTMANWQFPFPCALYLIGLLPRSNIYPPIPPVKKKQTIIMGYAYRPYWKKLIMKVIFVLQSIHQCSPSHNARMKTKLGCLQPNERKRKSPSPKLFNTGIQETYGNETPKEIIQI